MRGRSRAAYLQENWDAACSHALRALTLDPLASDPWRLLFALPDATPGKPPSLTCTINLARFEQNDLTVQWLPAMDALAAHRPAMALHAARHAVELCPTHEPARATLAEARECFDALNDDLSEPLQRMFIQFGLT